MRHASGEMAATKASPQNPRAEPSGKVSGLTIVADARSCSPRRTAWARDS
jgi:hypothetical protein